MVKFEHYVLFSLGKTGTRSLYKRIWFAESQKHSSQRNDIFKHGTKNIVCIISNNKNIYIKKKKHHLKNSSKVSTLTNLQSFLIFIVLLSIFMCKSIDIS